MEELYQLVARVSTGDRAGATESPARGERTGLAGVDWLAEVAQFVGADCRVEGERISRFLLECELGRDDVLGGEVVVGGGDGVARRGEE